MANPILWHGERNATKSITALLAGALALLGLVGQPASARLDTVPTTGVQKAVVILVYFPGQPTIISGNLSYRRPQRTPQFFTSSTEAQWHFNSLAFWAPGEGTPSPMDQPAQGSLRAYLREISYGALDLDGDTRGWYNAPRAFDGYPGNCDNGTIMAADTANYPKSYVDWDAGNGNYRYIRFKELAQEAIAQANSSVNFADYDGDGDGNVDLVIVVYAGAGTDTGTASIWRRFRNDTTSTPAGGLSCGVDGLPTGNWWDPRHTTIPNEPVWYTASGLADTTDYRVTSAALSTDRVLRNGQPGLDSLSYDGKTIDQCIVVPEYAEIGDMTKLIGTLLGWADTEFNSQLQSWDMNSTGWRLNSNDASYLGASGTTFCGRESRGGHRHPGDVQFSYTDNTGGFPVVMPVTPLCRLGGDRPSHPMARWKIAAQWLTPANNRLATPTSNQLNVGLQQLASAQNYGLLPITEPLAYRMWRDGQIGSEYFILENRRAAQGNFDDLLPGSGMLVSRVNTGAAPYTDQWFWRLLQADYSASPGAKDPWYSGNDGNTGDPLINRNEFHAYTQKPYWSRDHTDADSFVRLMNISVPGPTMTFDAYVSGILAVISGQSLAPDYVAPNTRNVVMAKLTLTAQGGDITIGSTPTTLGAGIAGAGAVATITVASTAGFPDQGYVKIDNEIFSYDRRTGTTFTGCNRGRYGTAQAAHLVGVTVSNIDFFVDESGSDTDDFDLDRVYLVRDMNDNGRVDNGEWTDANFNGYVDDDEALADAQLTQQTALFNMLDADPMMAGTQKLNLQAGESASLLVVYDVAGGALARVGQTLGARMANNGYVRVAMPYAVSSSNLPFVTTETVIAQGTLTLKSSPPAGSSVEQGSTSKHIHSLLFSAQNDTVDIASIRLDRDGTVAADADLTRVFLAVDNITDDLNYGKLDGGDAVINPGTNYVFANGTVTVTVPDTFDWYPERAGVQNLIERDFSGFLAAQANAGDATLNVDSVTGWPTAGYVKIDNEYVSYAGTVDNVAPAADQLTGCTRARLGTTDGTHLQNAAVTLITNRRVFVGVNVATTASVGKTFGARLNGPNFVGINAGRRVRNSNFPSVSNLFTIADRPEELSVNGASLAPSSATQGTTSVPMEKLVFSTTEDSVTITQIKVRQDGTTTLDTDVSDVYVYQDVDQDGAVTGADTQLGSTQKLVGGVATFSGLSLVVTSAASQQVIVVYDVAGTATAGATLTARLNGGDISVQTPDTVSGVTTIESGECTIDDTGDTLTVQGTSLATGNVQQGTASQVMASLAFTANQDYVDVTRLRLDEGGSSTADADVSTVDLYWDANGNGTREPNEVHLATGTFSGQTRTFTLDSDPNAVDSQPLRVTETAPQSVLIVYTVSPTATVGKTLNVRLVDATYVGVSAPDSVGAANLPFASTDVTLTDLPDTLTVERPLNVASTTVSRGTQKHRMAQLRLTVTDGGTNESVIVSALRLDETGTSTLDTDVSAVRIIDDANGDGAAGATEPTLGSGTFVNQTLTISFASPITVTQGTPRYLLIAYDISASATLAATVAARLVNNTYLTPAGNDVIATTNFPISTSEVTIADVPDTLTVSGNPPAATTLYAGQTNAVVQRLDLSAGSGVVTVSSVTFEENASGSSTDSGATEAADVAALRVYEDVDASGTLNTGDVQVGSGAYSSDATVNLDADPATVGQQPFQVASGAPKTLLVVYDVATGAAAGDILVNQVAAAGSVAVAAPDTVGGAYPINSNPYTIAAGGDRLTVTGTDVAPAQIAQSGSDKFLKLTLQANNPDAGDNQVTVGYLRLDETGTNARDADVSAVKVYKDNGNDTFLASEETLVGSGTLSSQTVNVQLNLGGGVTVFPGTDTVLWAVYDVLATAQVGSTLGAAVANSAYVTVSGNDYVATLAAAISSSKTTITDAGDTLTVTGSDKAPTTVTQAAFDVVMLQLKLAASSDDVTLSSVKVGKTGSSTRLTDVTAVRLYEDVNADGQYQVGETLLGSGVFTVNPGPLDPGEPTIAATISGMSFRVSAGTDRYVLVTYDVSSTAEEGKTVGARLHKSGYVTVQGLLDTVSAATFPITSTNSTIQSGTDQLVVTPKTPAVAPGSVVQGQLGVVMEALTLSTLTGAVTVNTITVDKVGTSAADGHVARVQLFWDENENGFVDSGEDQLGSNVVFTASRATINLPAPGFRVEAGTPKDVLVVFDIAANATVDQTLGTEFAAPANFVVATPDAMSSANFPITGGQAQVVAKGDTLLVTGGSIVPGAGQNVLKGQADVAMSYLRFTANSGSVMITSLKVDQTGTGVDLDTSAVEVWEDADLSGSLTSGDALIGTGAFAQNTATVTLVPSLTVAAGAPRQVLVVFDVAVGATAGNTLKAAVTGPASLVVAQPDVVATFAALASNAATVVTPADTLSVSGTSIAPSTAQQGQPNVGLLRLRLTATGAVAVDKVKVDLLGTGTKADLAAVAMYEDNGDDVFKPGEDLLLGANATPAATTEVDVAPNVAVTATTPKTVFVAYDIAAGATAGVTVGAQLLNASYLTLADGADLVAPFSTLQSSTPTIVQTRDILTVSEQVKPAAADVYRGQTDAVLYGIRLAASGNAILIDSIKLGKTTTSTLADPYVTAVKLYDDADQDGKIDAEESTSLATGRFTSGAVTLTLGGYAVSGAQPRDVLVAVDLSDSATINAKLGVRLVDQTYVSVPSPDVVQAFTGLTSDDMTVRAPNGALTVEPVSVTTPDPVYQRQAGVMMLGMKLTATGASAEVEGLTVSLPPSVIGTETDVATDGVKVYRDGDGTPAYPANGVLDANDQLLNLGGAGAALGTVTLDSIAGGGADALSVAVGTPERLFVTFDIAANATVGATVGAEVASVNSVIVSADDVVRNVNFPIVSATPVIDDEGDVLTVSSAGAVKPNTTLAANVSASDSEIPVASTTGFDSSGLVRIEDEVIAYTGRTTAAPYKLTGCARGQHGTLAASHANTAQVILTVAQAHALQGAARQVAQWLRLSVNPADGDSATLTSLTVDRLGTARDADFTAVRLYADQDADGTVSAPDQQLQVTAFAGGTATFANLSFTVTSVASRYLLVAVDLAGNAQPTGTIQTSLVSAAAVGVASPDTVSTANFPLSGPIKSIAATQDALTVTLTSFAPATAFQGTGNVLMARLTLAANQSAVSPTAIKLRQGGTAPGPADVEQVHLWLDVNNNNLVDFSADLQQDGTGKTPNAIGEATFALSGVEVTPTTPKNFLVTYDIGLSATVGNTVVAELSDRTYVSAGSTTVVGAFPLQSAATRILQGGDVLSVLRLDLANPRAQAVQGERFVPLMKLRLEASSGQILARSVKLRRTTVNDAELGQDADAALLMVYLNPDQNDTVDAGDTQIGVGSFSTGIATLTLNTGAGLDVTAGQPQPLLIVADISTTAKTGGTQDLGARLDDKSFVTVEQNGVGGNQYFNDIVAALVDPEANRDGAAIPTGALVSNFLGGTEYLDLIARGQTLTVAPGSGSLATVGQQAAQGEAEVGMLRLDLAVDADDVTVDKVVVDLIGTGTRGDVSAVKVYRDGGNGTLETGVGGDTLLTLEGGGTTTTFVAGATAVQATLDLLPAGEPTVTLANSVTLFIVYDVAANATLGAQLGASVARAASLVPKATDDVVAITNLPQTSQLVTVAAGQSLMVTRTDYAAGVTQGDTKAVFLGVTLDAPATNTANVTVQSLKINENGTGSFGSDISRVYVYEDKVPIGNFDPIADVLIGDSGAGALAPETPTQSVTVALDTSKDGSGNVGTAPVDSPTVAPGIKKYLLVLYDIASKADTGSTVGCEIPDTGVKVVSPGVVSGTFPLSTRTVAIADLPDLLTVQGTHLGPATAVQGKTGVVMAKLTLGIRGNDDSVTVTSVRVDQSGTAADSDVARVLLYDAGSNGTFDDPNDPATTTPDTLLAQGQFVGGTISFALALTKQVVVTTTRELLVVFDVADNAPPGATLAVSVVDASYFTVNAPDSVSPNTFPLATTPTTEIVSKSITLNVAGQNLAPATVKQGSRAAFLSLSVWTQTGTCRLDSVKVKRTGAGTDADVSLVMLYADSGSVANQLDVGDTLLAQGTLDPAAHAVDLQLDPPVSTYPTGYQVTSSQQRLLIVFDLAALAVVRTDAVGAEVAEAANVVASVSGSTVTTNSANFPLDSYNPTNPATRTDIAAGPTTLTVEGYSVAPDQAPQGSAVAMLMLRLIKYGAIAETVTSLTVDKLGTATASNVAGVDLYDDTNHNSVWDAGDTKVNVQSGQFGSPATIAGLAYAVNSSDGVFEQLFVVLKIADVANIGATVGVTLTDKTFVTLQGQAQPGDGVAAFPTGGLNSSLSTISRSVRDLTVVGTSLAPATAQPSQANVAMLKLDLTAAKGDVAVNSFTVDQAGLAQLGTDFTAMSVYLDDGDGTFDATKDTLLVSRGSYSTGSSVTFALTTFVVQPGTVRSLFLTADIGSATQMTPGRTIKLQLAAATSFNVGQDQVLGAFPIASGTTTLADDPPQLVKSAGTPPAGGTLVYNTRVVAKFNEEVTGAATLSNFTLTIDGTAVDWNALTPSPQIAYDNTTFTTTISGLTLKTAATWALTVGTGVQDTAPNPHSVAAPNNTDTGTVQSEFTPALRSAIADNDSVTVVFTVNMDEPSVETPANWTLLSPTTPAPGTAISLAAATFTYTAGSRTLRITGLSLRTGDTFRITASTAITDNYGNAMVVNDTTYPNYREGTVTGVNAPTIQSATATNSTLTVVFSEDVTGADVVANYSFESPTGTPVALTGVTVTYAAVTNTATLSGLVLLTGDTFKLKVANVTDANNNALSNTANTISGTVTGEAPPTVASSTATNETVTVTFTKDLSRTTVPAAGSTPGTTPAATSTTDPTQDPTNYKLESPYGTTVSLAGATFVYANKVTTIVGVTLKTDEEYRITVSNVTDSFQNKIGTPNSSVGKVTGVNPPTVVDSSARTNRLTVQFSESVLKTEAETLANYGAQSPIGTVVSLAGAAASYDDLTKSVTLTGINLPAGKSYQVTVSNVRDLVNNPVADPRSDTGTVVVVIVAEGGTSASGMRARDLVSIPMNLANPKAAATFGGTEIADRWDGASQSYQRYPQVNFDLVPGEGYWTHYTQTREIELGAGTLVPANESFRRLLSAGYDTLGNPFLSAVPWRLDSVKYDTGSGPLPLSGLVNLASRPVEPYLWAWSTFFDQWVLVYDPSYLIAPPGSLFKTQLEPSEAAFILASRPGVQLVLPSASALASTVTAPVEPVKRAASRSKASETEWAFELIASANEVTDRGTVVGVSSRAPAQIVSPPPSPAEKFVDLSLIGNGRAEFERRLAVDIRNEVATRAAWDLLLTTNQSNADVRITWPELSFVPKQYRLRIVDALTGEVQSLRSSSVLRLRTGREALTQRRLRLELYPAAEGGVRVSGLSVAPGRGGRGAGVSFSLSEDAAVTVKLVAANGRPVQTLGPIPLQAGLNNVPWDGRAVSSQAAPRGVYMLEVAARTDSGEVFRAVRSITLR